MRDLGADQELETKQPHHPIYRNNNAHICIKFIRKHCKKREIDCHTDTKPMNKGIAVFLETDKTDTRLTRFSE